MQNYKILPILTHSMRHSAGKCLSISFLRHKNHRRMDNRAISGADEYTTKYIR